LVITEEPFCPPFIDDLDALCRSPCLQCPVWLVDCCSVVPSSLVPVSSTHRAYAYEAWIKSRLAQYCSAKWVDQKLSEATQQASRSLTSEKLPFAPVDLDAMDLEELVAACEVDHGTPAVEQTPGGSSHGYERWKSYLQRGGLDGYARRRNDALDVAGPSRMSAYLNAGMVSPLRIAREVWAHRGAGKAKYVNEFLTWRGLSYAWCSTIQSGAERRPWSCFQHGRRKPCKSTPVTPGSS